MHQLLVWVTAAALGGLGCMPPSWGAGALLHPQRRHVQGAPSLGHREVAFDDGGVVLRGWLFPAAAASVGITVVVLHGIADNRTSGVWIAERLVPKGFDVLVYDARAHGESGGESCTYGFHEKRDLSRALDQLGIDRALLVGNSLGAAVALQAAAEDRRVIGVVAADTFSDLASIVRDRAPFFASGSQIREAILLAEREGSFRVADVSPVDAARSIRVPVLLLHGADDTETRPVHTEKVFAALGGPKRLRLVSAAKHGEALGRAWSEVEVWIDQTAKERPGVLEEALGSPGR
jgi:pimeloyl-ACP methyl ester carboxylesterase